MSPRRTFIEAHLSGARANLRLAMPATRERDALDTSILRTARELRADVCEYNILTHATPEYHGVQVRVLLWCLAGLVNDVIDDRMRVDALREYAEQVLPPCKSTFGWPNEIIARVTRPSNDNAAPDTLGDAVRALSELLFLLPHLEALDHDLYALVRDGALEMLARVGTRPGPVHLSVSADLDAIAGAAIDCWTQACEAFAKLREAFTDADGPVVMDIADALLQLHELATDSAPAARRAEGV